MRVEDVAKVAFDANRAYRESLGDFSQVPWELNQEWYRAGMVDAMRGWLHGLANEPKVGPEEIRDRIYAAIAGIFKGDAHEEAETEGPARPTGDAGREIPPGQG